MRMLVLGDPHSVLRDVDLACQEARRQGIDDIVQVGDWMFLNKEPELFTDLHSTLNRYAMTMWFLEGNHDNHYALAHAGAKPDAEDLVSLTNRIHYLPRGFTWEWDGVNFMSMGGAASVNKDYLTAGVSWWPEELITIRDVERAIDIAEHVDVLFSHDSPNNPSLQRLLDATEGEWPSTEIMVSAFNRQLLEEVVDAIDPALVVHGHYHFRYADLYNDTVVFGLDKASRGSSAWLVLDTETLLDDVEDMRQGLVERNR